MRQDDLDAVKKYLATNFSAVRARNDYGWMKPALNLVDCVLSLNRPYASMVLPRVQTLARRQPSLISLGDLSDLIQSSGGGGPFLSEHLDYNDKRRGRTLEGVCAYFQRVADAQSDATEAERLHRWAVSVGPQDYLHVRVPGFGPAGFQYFRMFCGVQTVKPDKYIVEKATELTGHPVSALDAVALFEKAAASLNLPLREIDAEIWSAGSGGVVVYGTVPDCARGETTPTRSAKDFIRQTVAETGQFVMAAGIAAGYKEVTLKTALSDLKNPKYCGSGGILVLKQVGGGMY
ncbi:MAG: hypothetical protein M0Z36_09705, partial [Thermaerobacter sp.]|nr:hypothetical protein [Thermaerobacter sp.]